MSTTKELLLGEPQTKEDRLAICRRAVEASGLDPDLVLQAAWHQGLVLSLAAEAIGVDLWKGSDAEARELHHRAAGQHPPERTPWEMRSKAERKAARDLVRRMMSARLVFSPDDPENRD